jgi:hypothetical protein
MQIDHERVHQKDFHPTLGVAKMFFTLGSKSGRGQPREKKSPIGTIK